MHVEKKEPEPEDLSELLVLCSTEERVKQVWNDMRRNNVSIFSFRLTIPVIKGKDCITVMFMTCIGVIHLLKKSFVKAVGCFSVCL